MSEPLNRMEAKRLAEIRKNAFINKHFRFSTSEYRINPNYRASLDSDGRWDRISVPLRDSLSCLTELLRHKRHEWWVIALADDNECKLIWANKGDDNSS